MSLSDKKCVPCQGGEPTLTDSEIEKYLSELNANWRVAEKEPKKIVKTYEFKDFKEAVSFVNKVADVAESEDHHPDIFIHAYKKVRLELSTHKIGGLHQNDFILASKIEKLSQ